MNLEKWDKDLQMPIKPMQESDMNHLRWLRWEAENGFFDRYPMSVPMGDNVFRLTMKEINHYAMIEGNYKDTALKIPVNIYEQTVK